MCRPALQVLRCRVHDTGEKHHRPVQTSQRSIIRPRRAARWRSPIKLHAAVAAQAESKPYASSLFIFDSVIHPCCSTLPLERSSKLLFCEETTTVVNEVAESVPASTRCE